MPLLRRARRHLAPLAVALAVLVATTACLPQSHPNRRFRSCTIAWHDATASSWRSSDLHPYLVEVQQLSGLRFTWSARAEAEAEGLLVERLVGGEPQVAGTTMVATSVIDGQITAVWARIRLRAGTSAGLRRHELGHLLNLAHNPGSELMRPAPSPTATYSAAERQAIRDLARRSGCR